MIFVMKSERFLPLHYTMVHAMPNFDVSEISKRHQGSYIYE